MTKTARTHDGFLWTSDNASWRGLTTDAVVPSSNVVKNHYDVIVIGAGFAGLTAARDLVKASNLSVLLIEARDRIGGRTFTARELDEEFEIGGQWVHWSQPNVWRELSRYGLDRNVVATSGDPEVLLGPQLAEFEELLKQFFTIDGVSAKQLLPWPMDPLREPAAWRKYDHLSVRTRLDMMTDLPQEYKDLLEMHCTSVSSLSADETAFMVPLRWYALGGYTFAGSTAISSMYRIANGGMTSLAKAMLSEANYDRVFDTEVTAINQDANGVTVQTGNGNKVTADLAICTIPLNVLPSIKFNPPLPPLQEEAIQRGMAHKGGKLIYKLAGKQQVYVNGAPPGLCPFIISLSDDSNTTKSGTKAVAFSWSGAFADKDDKNDLTDTDSIIPALTEFIKPQSAVTAYLVNDWANDPYSRGAWMTFRPNDMSKYMEALQQTHGRVFMASADWAKGCAGFVDGAIEQGAKAAVEVMKALGVWKA